MERIMIVPLRKARRGPKTGFAKKAVRFLKEFVARHMKAEDVKVGGKLNEFLWSRGIKNPPRKVEVRALKKGDTVFVELATVSDSAWKKFVGEEEQKKKKVKKEKEEKKEETRESKEAKEVLEEIAKEEPEKKAPAKKKTATKKKPAKKKEKKGEKK